MREVAGEVVRRELILGIEPFLFQVSGPFAEHWPIAFGESRTALGLFNCGYQNQHIA